LQQPVKEIFLLSGRHVGTNDAERLVAERANEFGQSRIRYCAKRAGQQAGSQHHGRLKETAQRHISMTYQLRAS
jgi:hypothetical protein